MLASYNEPNLYFEGFQFSADDSQTCPGAMTYQKRVPSSTPCFQHLQSFSHSRNPSTASSNFSYPSDSPSVNSSPYMNSYSSQHYLHPPSMQQEHLPTPTHTPTSQEFSINETPRSNNNFQDVKATASAGGNVYGRYARSNASNHSVQGQDLPVTPQTVNSDDFEHYQPNFATATTEAQPSHWPQQQQPFQDGSTFRNIPKLDRTISDIYADELYQPYPNQQHQAQSQQHYNQSYLNPQQQQHSQFMQKALRLANQARSQSPNSDQSRDFSPFRQGSPYSMASAGFQGHMPTAAAARQQQRQMASAQAMSQYHAKREESHPKTISPKDAVLDYHDPDESSPSLFPEVSSQQSNLSDGQNSGQQNGQTQFQPASAGFQFATPGMPVSAQNDTKFQPPQFGTQGSSGSLQSGLEFPAHMATMETSRSDTADDDDDNDDDDDEEDEDDQDNYEEFVEIQRPAQTSADTGTYTCTYHGCRERFTSPMLLQKHKREDHRSTAPGTHHSSSPAIGQMSQQAQMTQAGPHRCDRINPQTGKPCNSVFSRPYDLTRHEDTIHNRAKAKVRCHLCTEEKTFSRNDALTRHMKVVHPNVPWPSKHKRRR